MVTILLTDTGAGAWVVPDGVTSLRVELVGAGGGGGSADNTGTGLIGGRTKFGAFEVSGGSGGRAVTNVSSTNIGGLGGRGGSAISGISTANFLTGLRGLQGEPESNGFGGRNGLQSTSNLYNYGFGGNGGNHDFFDNTGGGGGGGGGYDFNDSLQVTPGESIAYTVGAGGRGGRSGLAGRNGRSGRSGVIRLTYDAVPTIELSADIGSSGGVLPTLNAPTELSADIGSSGGVLPTLNTRRLRPTQTIMLPAAVFETHFNGQLKEWNPTDNIDIVFDLVSAGEQREFQNIRILVNGTVSINIASPEQTGSQTGDDLSDQFENDGQIILKSGTKTLTLNLEDANGLMEPYTWSGAQPGTVDFFNSIPAAGADLTVIFNAFIEAPLYPTIELSADIGGSGGLLPTLNAPIELSADIGSSGGLLPTLNAPIIELSADIGGSGGVLPELTTLLYGVWDGVGYLNPIVLARLEATVSGADITVDPVTALLDGDLVVANDLTISGVERHGSGTSLRLRKTGTGGFSTYFNNRGTPQYPTARLFIILGDGTIIRYTIGNTGGGFNNWWLSDRSQVDLINGIVTGDEFLLVIAEPKVITPVVTMGIGAGLVPLAEVKNPGAISVSVTMGSGAGLVPLAEVKNPGAISVSVTMGIGTGLLPRARVLNPLLVTIGGGAGLVPLLSAYVPQVIELETSFPVNAGMVPRLFDELIEIGDFSTGGSAGLSASLKVGKNVNVAVSMGGVAGNVQNLVVSNPTAIVGVRPMIAWVMEIAGVGPMREVFRIWSGLGDLDWNGVIWKGTDSDNGAIVAVSSVTDAVGSPNNRATISVSVPSEAVRELLAADIGPVTTVLQYIYSLDNGRTYRATSAGLAGQLSNPRFGDGIYTVEIETWSGDVDRGEPKFWSDETQRAEYPGDKGFEFVRALEQGLEIKWPP